MLVIKVQLPSYSIPTLRSLGAFPSLEVCLALDLEISAVLIALCST